jgi:ParB-like chromosome segregation protein Spo0J
VAKVERYFDVEAKRVVEGNKIVRKLDGQLREMTRRGPLAQLQGHNRSPSTRQSSSRAVTFAPEKSIVLDLGREESSDPATEEGSGGGLTNSYASTYTSQSANSPAMGLTKASEEGDIGGTSIAFSFNDTTESSLMKRRKTEVASV